jgi:transposase
VARRLTAEERRDLSERARAMKQQGLSRRAIRDELGISDSLLRALLHGTPRAGQGAREAAVALRRSGCSYSEITAELGVSRSTLSGWLRGVAAGSGADDSVLPASGAPSEHVRERRETARRLRAEGLPLSQIAQELGVSVKSAYIYTADLPVPPSSAPKGRPAAELQADLKAYWARENERRAVVRSAQEGFHARGVGPVTREQLHLMAVVAYWCEGSKSKPWAVREQVSFLNSDLGLIRLWLAFLDEVGFPHEHRKYNVMIHESADVEAATRSWAEDIGVPAERFGRPTLKRHNPRTVRLNTGEHYRGCLIVRLVQCVDLYRMIAGTWTGIMGALPTPVECSTVGEAQSRVV